MTPEVRCLGSGSLGAPAPADGEIDLRAVGKPVTGWRCGRDHLAPCDFGREQTGDATGAAVRRLERLARLREGLAAEFGDDAVVAAKEPGERPSVAVCLSHQDFL